MMRTAVEFVGPGEVAVAREPAPEPGDDEVLVRTIVSAVSPGTELLVYRGEVPRELPTDESLPALEGQFSYPLRYGYAAVGEVIEFGDEVDPSWDGRTVFAFNPHESHFTARPEDLQPVPPSVTPETAALLPSVETAVSLAMDARPVIGERGMVFGQGLVGLLTTSVLAGYPIERLVAVDPLPLRREHATRLGADEALTPEAALDAYRPNGTEEGRDPTDPGRGADFSIELSGNPAALDDAIATTGYDGRVLVGSWYGTKPTELHLGGRFHRSRISLRSSQVSTIDPSLRGRWNSARRMGVAWNHLVRADVDPLVGDQFAVTDAPEAYELLDNRPYEAVSVLFTYD